MSTLGIPSSMSKLRPPTHLTSMLHADVTIIFTKPTRLNLQSTSNKFTRKSGDVPLVAIPDNLIFHHLTRRWYKNLATTDYVRWRTSLPQTATMLTFDHSSFSCPRVPLSTPHVVTYCPRHHTRWPGRYNIYKY